MTHAKADGRTAQPKARTRHAARTLERAAHDPELAALTADPAVLGEIRGANRDLSAIIEAMLAGYGSRPAIGARSVELVTDPSTGRTSRRMLEQYTTTTYAELGDRVHALASALRGNPDLAVQQGEFVVTLGFSSLDYIVADLATALVQAVAVPLQGSLAGQSLAGILTDTEAVTITAPVEDLDLAVGLALEQSTVRSIIVLDVDDQVDDDREAIARARAALAEAGSTVHLGTIAEAEAWGRENPTPLPEPSAEGRDRMALLIHSSGSTGTPKGAIYFERHVWTMFDPGAFDLPVVRLVFAPMNHLLGRTQVYSTLTRGGTAYITARSDLTTLFEDFRLTSPTEGLIFPRVLEMIHRHFLGQVAARVAAGEDLEAAREAAMLDMRAGFLGERISLLTTGSAPTTPEIKAFISECFQITMLDGYGSTETGSGIIIRDRVMRPPVIDYRLRDVPELGYFTTDKPFPRGELCVKTENAVPGYFKRPEATAALHDEDGFLLTGDIMEERGADHLVFLDRRNDVLKLSNGEFVAVGNVGTAFENGSAAIDQIFVHGESARSYLLAVVVPNPDVMRERLGSDPTPAAERALLRDELRRVGAEAGLKSAEVPRDIIVEHEHFSHENGLLSSVQKRMRPNLSARYGPALADLYSSIERGQEANLLALRDPNSTQTVPAKVRTALAATLGAHDLEEGNPMSFLELGGDSLGAAGFAALVTDVFGVDLPVGDILSPTGSIASWSATIERALAGDSLPTPADIHGADATTLKAADLTLEAFLGEGVGADLDDRPIAEPKVVLVTGATGFLGRFLALDWLEYAATVGGSVICLVRANDAAGARARLDEAYAGDPALAARFAELAADHLEIVRGDVAAPRLGLSASDFTHLAERVDHIVHPAALVNHVLDYEALFAPNVAGTAEVIRLALTTRRKGIDLVSTVAVTRHAGPSERDPLRDEIRLGRGYTGGYGQSKWAAEHLLHRAHREHGIPVTVFRGDMMLPHRTVPGAINLPDVFSRWLLSTARTGAAPDTYYRADPAGQGRTGHYDGLPVDTVAAAIGQIGRERYESARTFHVANPHVDDGLGLDTFARWIDEAGYPVAVVGTHAEWVTVFEQRLLALSVDEQQRSSLPVLDSLRYPYPLGEGGGSEDFVAATVRVGMGELPHLSHAYILKCLADLRQHGYLPVPAVEAV